MANEPEATDYNGRDIGRDNRIYDTSYERNIQMKTDIKNRNVSPWGFRIFLVLLAIFFVFLATRSCASTMVMPDGCKPEKQVKHKMIEPDYPKNPKKLKQGKQHGS